MLTTGYSSWLWLALYCLSLSICSAQSETSQNTLLAFQQNQQALAQSFGTLVALNPAPQQMHAWEQQNSTMLADQQQLALNMGAQSAVEPMLVTVQPNIPANAPSTLADFLTNQATLANATAQIHNQLLNALPAEVSEGQVSTMQQSEIQLFQQQEKGNVQLLAQQAQSLANVSAQQPIPLPPPLVIPAGATPQMAAFLTARAQLMRAQITFSNQYLTATPAVRQEALTQWLQQNASQFQQVRALAQNLPATTPSSQN